jgi:hypothetical protein
VLVIAVRERLLEFLREVERCELGEVSSENAAKREQTAMRSGMLSPIQGAVKIVGYSEYCQLVLNLSTNSHATY